MKRHLRPFVPVSLVPRAFGTIKGRRGQKAPLKLLAFSRKKRLDKGKSHAASFSMAKCRVPPRHISSAARALFGVGARPRSALKEIRLRGPPSPRPRRVPAKPSALCYAVRMFAPLTGAQHSKVPSDSLRSRRKFQPLASPSAFFGAHPPRKNAFQAFPPRPTAYPKARHRNTKPRQAGKVTRVKRANGAFRERTEPTENLKPATLTITCTPQENSLHNPQSKVKELNKMTIL